MQNNDCRTAKRNLLDRKTRHPDKARQGREGKTYRFAEVTMLVFYIRIYEGVTGKGMIAEAREGKEKGLGKGTGIKGNGD